MTAASATSPPEPAAKPRRDRARLLFWAMLAALVSCLLAAPGLRAALAGADDEDGVRGYTASINNIFVPMNWLRVNEPDPDRPETRIVDLTPEAAAHREVIDFFVRSPLLRDIAANDERLWTIAGRTVRGLDPAARSAPQPFAADRWSGNILYGSALPSATLYGDRDGQSGANIEIEPLRRGEVRPAAQRVRIDSGPAAITVRQHFLLTNEAGAPLAEVRLVGGRVIVFPEPGASLDVDTPAGRREVRNSQEGWRPALELAQGGSIAVLRNERRLAGFRLGSLSTALSRYRPFAGRFLDPVLGSLGRDIQSAFLASGMADGDVQITLNRDLHQNMQIELERFVAAEFGRARPQPVRAAALAMDAMTGEVLALASYPGPRPVDDPGAPLSGGGARNNNFATLPIGSVAKVPVSAAILSQHPGLRSLRTSGGGAPFARALGIDMDGEQENGPSGEIDFAAFLRRSSNRYATTLMLLALSVDPWRQSDCESEEYWLSDRNGNGRSSRRRAPIFVLERVPAPCGDRFAMPVGGALSSALRTASGRPNWVSLLNRMFGLPGVENAPDRYDTSFWPRFGDRAQDEEPEGSADEPSPDDPAARWRRAFRAVSPERESFRLGAIRQFHNDYVSLILGGVHSRWTTVKVAEIYSRIVTGRRIEATLLRQPGRAVAPALTLLDPDARLALLEGMRGVVEGDKGTAVQYMARGRGRLEAPLAVLRAAAGARPGEEIRIFAKTGTPTVARVVEDPAWVVLRNLEAQRLVVLDGERLVFSGTGQRESDLAALRRLPEAALAQAGRRGVTPQALVEGLRRLRIRVGRSEIRGPNNHLNLPTMRELPQPASGPRNNGGVIAMVIGRYCIGAPPNAAPQRAIALVINFQVRGAVNPAGEFARLLLQRDSPLLRRLFLQRSRCREARP